MTIQQNKHKQFSLYQKDTLYADTYVLDIATGN